jgi:hypothetical protein
MAEPDPSDNPFANIPFLGDIAKAMASQGSMHWEIARQLAILGANEIGADQNVNPASRIAIENLVPIALMHVREVSGVDLAQPDLEAVTPAMWAHRTLETYKPLFEELAASLAGGISDGGDDCRIVANACTINARHGCWINGWTNEPTRLWSIRSSTTARRLQDDGRPSNYRHLRR